MVFDDPPPLINITFSSNLFPDSATRHSHHRMSWPYKKVLVIGATSGIGEALAIRCVQAGSSVIVSGRRTDKLEDFVHRHGKNQCSAFQFDITDLAKIPDFAAEFECLTLQ